MKERIKELLQRGRELYEKGDFRVAEPLPLTTASAAYFEAVVSFGL